MVPTFTGQNIADATKNARDLGLTVGEITYDPYNIAEPGQVVEQSLEPTSEVPGGTKISFTVSGSKNDQQSQTSRVAEFSRPADMEGMLKVEFEQDGVILDSQYLSASLGKVSYTFTGDPGTSSYVCAYFTSLDTEATKVSDIQEVIF